MSQSPAHDLTPGAVNKNSDQRMVSKQFRSVKFQIFDVTEKQPLAYHIFFNETTKVDYKSLVITQEQQSNNFLDFTIVIFTTTYGHNH